jgi:hypothetical protein
MAERPLIESRRVMPGASASTTTIALAAHELASYR